MKSDETSTTEEESDRQVLRFIEQQWEALRGGKQIQSDAWASLHPQGQSGIADMNVLLALNDAVCSVQEDSQDLDLPHNQTSHAEPAETQALVMPGATFEFSVGHTIGKYEVKEILGRGGQATTYKAWDPDLQRHVVIKLYHGAATMQQRDAVLEEGQKLSKIRSPYVVQCYGVERYRGAPYLVLDFISGVSLQSAQKSRPLSVSQALDVISKTAEGLAAVHARGLLHLDVKPSNILIADDGNPRLVDFGLSKLVGDQGLASASGTLAFMAPEQARGDIDRIDQRTDLFGLGATLYFLLTGASPHQGSTPAEVFEAARRGEVIPPRERNKQQNSKQNVPRDVEHLCMRCLAKAPERRFDSASDLARAIRQRSRRLYGPLALVTVFLLLFLTPTIYSHFHSNPSSVVEPAKVVDLILHTRQSGDEKAPIQTRMLVKDGMDQSGEVDKLGPDGDFHLYARLSRPSHWGLLWFDTAGRVEMASKSGKAENEVEYPEGLDTMMSVNPADPRGIHLLVLVVSDTPLKQDTKEVQSLLATIVPRPTVSGPRGPGEVRRISVKLPPGFLREIQQRLPSEVRPVRVIPLVIEK